MSSDSIHQHPRIPVAIWKKMPQNTRYVSVKLESGEVISRLWINEAGVIEGQEALGFAGVHGTTVDPPEILYKSSIIAAAPGFPPRLRFWRWRK